MASEFETRIHERKNTLIVAKATAGILKLSGCEPQIFSNSGTRPIFEARARGILRIREAVEVGQESFEDVVSSGWMLTKHITSNNEHASTEEMVVLEHDGDLAVVGRTSSFVVGNGYFRTGAIGMPGEEVDYPDYEISRDGRRRTRVLITESEIQQKLARLVVQDDLHIGTPFEQALAELDQGYSVVEPVVGGDDPLEVVRTIPMPLPPLSPRS